MCCLLRFGTDEIVILTTITALLCGQSTIIGFTSLITVKSKVDIHNFLIVFLHLYLFFSPHTATHLLLQNPADSSICAVHPSSWFGLSSIF